MTIIATLRDQPTDAIAVRVGTIDIDYARFMADVAATATLLADEGVGPGSRVGIRAGTLSTGLSYANWVAHLATLHLGATHVSIVEAASLSAVGQVGAIDSVIAPARGLDAIPPAIKRIQFECDAATPLATSDWPEGDETAAVRLNLTSGTTGKPRFIAWDHAMILGRVAQVGAKDDANGLALGPDTIFYPLLHMRTTAGFRYPLAVWQAGGCVLLPDDPQPVVRDTAALGRSTLIAASPVQLSERVRQFAEPWAGKADRTIVVLGGRLPVAVRESTLATACARLLIGYGSTETGSIAIGSSDVIDRHPGAVGFVRSGVTVEVVDLDRKPVKPGDPGLVRIKADLMGSGYQASVGEPATGHFADGYFYPGDIGRLFDDGLLAIEGRTNDTFNVGGWKVNASDLEAKLAFLPGVDDLCAFVMPLAEGDLLSFAVVTHDKVDLKRVAAAIQSKLPKGRTFHLVRVQSIPRNAMGKVPRSMIADKLTAAYGASRKNLTNA